MKASNLFIVGAAAALLPFAAAVAQSPSPSPDPAEQPAQSTAQPAQSGGATFESLDTNSDGRISKTEAEADANVKAQFANYDLNGDGFIERAEVTQANTAPKTPTPQ